MYYIYLFINLYVIPIYLRSSVKLWINHTKSTGVRRREKINKYLGILKIIV